jgi:hypothetical protein
MAEYPSLVVVPTSPHHRLAEAVASVGTLWGKAKAQAHKACEEANRR